jgi:integrase
MELLWMQEIGRPIPTKRIPVVLTVEEVSQVLLLMNGVTGLLARLIYGTGLRLREALSLRIKDIDFGWRVIVPWMPNTHAPANHGPGTGCFLRQRCC